MPNFTITLFPDPAIRITDLTPDIILSKSDLREEFSPITTSEVWDTLKRCKTDTAPGHDQIIYSTVRAFHSAIPAILPALFNAIYMRLSQMSGKLQTVLLSLTEGKVTMQYQHPIDQFQSQLVLARLWNR
jgi:hypothetical protein